MTSFYLLVSLLLFLVLALTLVVKLLARRSVAADFPFTSCETLCTPAERAFLGLLDLTVPDGYRVFAKVRLADLIKVSGELKASDRQAALNRIIRKHVDFVTCKAEDLAIAGVIELDDRSHDRPDRRRRDAFIDEAMGSAGIPILHLAARRSYEVAEVKRLLTDLLGIGTETGEDKGAYNLPGEQTVEPAVADYGECPNCGKPMVERIVKHGPHAGKKILACSAFPKCKTVLPYREPEDPELNEVINAPRFRMS